ncbi:hypothetical protein MIND_01424700 [Mycena indigotica]|uniref:F-box domain-containing protein n=1 Tax=Mycena indigotica TaxID=2126181 RepID=A0A8H6RY21_9AGAR|nr:uncharacterized protein MIND_01424700 [Mycena indigotica]KAF7288788.1 hypothetical protein MIND_01424700 [Mycena indigotica]
MHRCLETPEIALQVVQQLANSPEDISVPSLARLARTCRRFSDFALEELWRGDKFVHRPLLHLLWCFPPDLVEIIERNDGTRGGVNQLRPFVLQDLDRPERYFRLVKTLFYHPGDTTLDTRILTLFSTWIPWDCIFPSLQTLTWSAEYAHADGDSPEIANLLRFLLAPQLHTLHLGGIGDMSLSLLTTVASRKLPIRELSISAPTATSPAVSISAFLRSLRRLEALEIEPPVDQQAFCHLTSLPTLESLIMHGTFDICPCHSSQHESFPALNDSSWYNADLNDIIRFLPKIHASPLSSFCLDPDLSTTTTLVSAVISGLAGLPGPVQALRKFTIINLLWEREGRWEGDQWRVSASALEHLARFNGLTHVALEAPGGFDLDDDGLAGLLGQLPQLERLCLNHPKTAAQLTIGALVIAARHTTLQRLVLAMDGGTGPLPAVGISSASMLTELYVGHTHVGDPTLMAGFLRSLFPELQHIGYAWFGEVDELDGEDTDAQLAAQQLFKLRWEAVADIVEQIGDKSEAKEDC